MRSPRYSRAARAGRRRSRRSCLRSAGRSGARRARCGSPRAAPSATSSAGRSGATAPWTSRTGRRWGLLLGGETANMIRFGPGATALVIGAWQRDGATTVPLGARVPLEGDTAGSRIFRTGEPVRVDDFDPARDRAPKALRELGFDAAVGAPVVLSGELW